VAGKTGEFNCANPKCNKKFTARLADRKRGWARFCSKSCAWTKNLANTPSHKKSLDRLVSSYHDSRDDFYEADYHPFSSESLGQW